MYIFPECIICHQQQTLRIVDLITDDASQKAMILRHVLRYLADAEWQTDPMTMTRGIYDLIHQLTGVADPYQALKRQSNAEALQVYDELKDHVRTSADPILTASQLAVAGNIMDFGARAHFDMHATIDQALQTDFAIDRHLQFREQLQQAGSLLVFADNAGELVFDRLLIETLLEHAPLRTISVVVKDEPIINDATLEDARQVGLTDIPQVQFLSIDVRQPRQGASLWLRPEVMHWIHTHDVVISKGQANYEIMSDLPGIYFLLMAKCDVVADYIGTHRGAFLFTCNAQPE